MPYLHPTTPPLWHLRCRTLPTLYSEAMQPGRCRIRHGAASRCKHQWDWGPQISPCPGSQLRPVGSDLEIGTDRPATGSPQPTCWDMKRGPVAFYGPEGSVAELGSPVELSAARPRVFRRPSLLSCQKQVLRWTAQGHSTCQGLHLWFQ